MLVCRQNERAVVGVGVLMDQPVVIIVGIIGGALGWVLKERGDF